jgi:hypothetical protein
MIVRIMEEGQFELPDTAVDDLNRLDEELEATIHEGEAGTFAEHLTAMQAFVRSNGKPVPDDEIVPSDAVLPPPDISLDELRELLGEEGLIPG